MTRRGTLPPAVMCYKKVLSFSSHSGRIMQKKTSAVGFADDFLTTIGIAPFMMAHKNPIAVLIPGNGCVVRSDVNLSKTTVVSEAAQGPLKVSPIKVDGL